jgi:hypothetical protein
VTLWASALLVIFVVLGLRERDEVRAIRRSVWLVAAVILCVIVGLL